MRPVLGIRLKLLFLVLLATLPSIGVVLYSGVSAQRQAVDDATQEAVHIARDLAQRQEQTMASTRQFMASLTHLPQVRGMDGPACVALFQELLTVNPIYSDMVLSTPSGDVLATSQGIRPGIKLMESPFFPQVLRTGSFAVGGYRKSRFSGRDVLVCGHPVMNARHEIVGVVSTGLLLSTFADIVQGVSLPHGSTIFVADSTGTRLFHRHFPDPRPDVYPIGGKVTLSQRGRLEGTSAKGPFFAQGLDGLNRLYVVEEARLPQADTPYLYVGVSIPKVNMAEQSRGAMLTSLAVLALATLLAAAGAWLTGRKVFVERIERLAQVAERFAKGDLAERTGLPGPALGGAPDELGILAQEMDRIGEELSSRSAEREATLTRLARTQFAVDNAGDEIYWADENARFIYVNERAAKSLGYRPEELAERTVFDVDMDFPRGSWPGLLATLTASGPVAIETRHRTSSGIVVPKELTLSLVHSDGGPLIFATGRDISERRRHEAVLRSLLDETASVTGQAFFNCLATQLVSVLGVHAAFIGEYVGSQLNRVRSLSFVTREGNLDAPEQPLADTPGVDVPADGHLLVSMGAQQRFPRAVFLVKFGIESYLGVPIQGPGGQKIGHMSIMAQRPMGQDQNLVSILRLFAQRAAVELTRLKAERELRASLSEKEVLLKEIHHRVKNNMQIISSLLSLQFRDVSDPAVLDLLAQSRARILTMALVHEDLYQTGNLAQVNFRNYLGRLAQRVRQGLSEGAGIDLELDIDELALGIDQAIPLGLLCNELLTNAFKHAFPDGRSGLIRISLRHEQNQVRLTVSDNGKGLPRDFAPGAGSTLGLQLVWSLAEQLGGSMQAANDGGATFSVTFPVA